MKWLGRGRAPWWTEGLSGEEWARGAPCMQQVLREYGGGTSTRWRRTGVIAPATDSGNPIRFFLGPLLHHTKHPDPDVWTGGIRREFAFQAERTPQVRRATTDEERLRPRLLPLVLPTREVSGMTDALVRRWSDRVTAVLCQRHPEGTRWVSHDQARRVGADPAALWDAALANVRAEPLRLETVAGDGGAADLAFATGDDRFGLGHLLRLGELIQGPAPHGVLVGILGAPGLFAFHKVVRRREAEAAVEALRRLSPDGRHDTSFTGVLAVHWWRGGGPNDTEEVAPRAELSPRMAEMLDGLPD